MNLTVTRKITTLAIAAFTIFGQNSLRAYTLPTLPTMPIVSAGTAGSIPMGNPANFAETNMDFAIETNGPFAPTWTSIAANVPGNGTPAWLRKAKFGIWFHYGPQANLQSGDWSAQHMYQQGASAYNFHTNHFGHPTTNGYKDVINAWAPTNYNPAGLAQLYYNAGARFVLVQGVHHDNFDNWNSRYNPWNMVNFGAKRDTMAEWTNALRSLGMKLGVAFHHEYSWWFSQPDFLSDSSGPFAGISYDAVTATNSAGTWWQNYDVRRLYNQDLHKYQGISTPNQGYWNPTSGVFTNDLDYCHWYATQWALRILDVVENYDPDFIYTDGNSTQPFSGYATGTGYKCDAMQRVIAHYYNRTLQRHGQLDTMAVVKFHNGDHIGTTFEGGYSSTIKEDQPWLAEYGLGNWFWNPGISYDNGGAIVWRLLEAISRDGAMAVNIPNRPDGALDSGATNMLAGVGQWMAIHSEGIYGSRAWVTPTDGSFRFTVGTNGLLYAFYEGIPSGGTTLRLPTLASGTSNLQAPITSVSLLGSAAALTWSQTSTGLVVTLPAVMPSLPSGTAIGLKIGPAAAIGSAAPVNFIALPATNQVALSWFSPSATATYNVKRSLTHGGPYTLIASNLTSMTFSDTNVSPATLYFYVVTGTDAAGESVNSSEASASLAGPPSSNWLTEDVGAVGATGSFGLNNGVFTVQGSGADIWNTADEFRYVLQAVKGDWSITCRVTNMQNTAGWAKAGLMFRETLDASSKYVVNYISPANGVALQQRASSGGSAAGVANTTGLTVPYWLRLTRMGNNFFGYRSPDGTNWTLVGSTIVEMNAIAYIGLEVCSVNDGVLNTSYFDNVSISAPQFPTAPASLNAVGGNGVVGLNWSAGMNASNYRLKRATSSGGPYSVLSSSLTATTYFDTSVANGATYYYAVSSTNAIGESVDSPVASATPSLITLSAPWAQADVGSTTPAGSGGNNNGTFLLQGSGADVWGTADAFHFVYLQLTNDCTMTARVLNMQNPATTSKAGIDIRDQLNANCVHALVDVTPGVGVEFIRRVASNGTTTAVSATGITAPQWIRIVRSSLTNFTAYRSPDGITWFAVGSTVIIPTMSSNAYVGLVVNSHSSGTLCLAQFDNVSWTPAATPAIPAWLSATVGDNSAVLSWAASDNATGYNLKRSTTNGGPYNVIAPGAPGYSYVDAPLTNGVAYYYVVSATNAAGESGNSMQIGIQPVSTVPLTFNYGINGNQIQLSWPADHTGWRLQVQTNTLNAGIGTNWVTVANSTNVNQFSTVINPINGSVFFRLVYP